MTGAEVLGRTVREETRGRRRWFYLATYRGVGGETRVRWPCCGGGAGGRWLDRENGSGRVEEWEGCMVFCDCGGNGNGNGNGGCGDGQVGWASIWWCSRSRWEADCQLRGPVVTCSSVHLEILMTAVTVGSGNDVGMENM